MHKTPNAFKGFETTLHGLIMTGKMYIYTFMFILLLHIILVAVYFILARQELINIFLKALTMFRFDIAEKALRLIVKQSLLIFIVTSPVWFLFPVLFRLYKRKAKQITQDKVLRGVEIISEDELNRQIRKDCRQRNVQLSDCLRLGGVYMPPWAESRHVLVLGRPGVGKTTLLGSIIEQLIERGKKIVVHDMKGDYISMFYDPERDLIFNPLDQRSLHWCLFNEIQMDSDIDSIANSLIPPSYREDKFWVDGARDVFASILHILHAGNERTNEAIYRYTTMTEGELLEILQSAGMQIEAARRAVGYLQGYERGSKVASDILATMRQYTNCFYYARWLKDEFSIQEWLASDRGGIIFISNFAKIAQTLRPLLSLFIDTMLQTLLSMSETTRTRVYFILDEFQSLQRLNSVITALATVRSKGGSIWISTQNITQIQKLYSQENTDAIINNCNTIVSFATNDVTTCEYISRTMGEQELLETDESISMGVEDYRDGLSLTRKRRIDRVILPSQLSQLEDFNFYLKMLNYHVCKTKVTRKHREVRNESFVINPIFKLDR